MPGITSEYYLARYIEGRGGSALLFPIRKSQQEFARAARVREKEGERRDRDRATVRIINRRAFSQRNLNVMPR